MMHKTVIILGALLSAFAVLFGAFGAHLLQPILIENGKENTYDTAIIYFFPQGVNIRYNLKKLKMDNTILLTGYLFFLDL